MTADAERNARDGVIAALIAYTIWGFLPVYFLFTKVVSPEEMLAHRIVWSVPFGALIIAMRAQWKEVGRALRTPSTVGWLAVSALVIALNWLIYIYAVQQAQIFQASLGYYINPLLYVLVGVVFFKEQLRGLQLVAVVLATLGVLVLTLSGGEFPIIALVLAVSFTIYGVVRKRVVIGGMPGLFIETLLLFPIALLALGHLMHTSAAVFGTAGAGLTVLILASGPLTVLPLLCFALAARRLNLSTIGFLQFIGPTLQFAVGVASGEELSLPRLVCFALIWLAVGMFCADSLRARSRRTVPGKRG
ncbi:MAG: EamA family transporter RarD [Pseudomonadota bacterium]